MVEYLVARDQAQDVTSSLASWRPLFSRRFLARVLVVAWATGLVVAGINAAITSKPDSTQAAAYGLEGVQAQQRGHLDEAAEAYRRALAHDPRNTLAYYNLGVIAQTQGQSSAAEDYYRAALSFNGRLVPAMYNLAILRTTQAPQEAVHLYEQAISIEPRDAVLHLNLGFVLHALGRDADARREFATAIGLDPRVRPRIPVELRPIQP